MCVWGGESGVSERSCSINGIKCLLNGRLKKKCKILEGCMNQRVAEEDERAGR